MSVRLAVFASGGGSNLQALLDRFAEAEHVCVALVVSDRADAGALARAARAGVAAECIAVSGRATAEVERETLDTLAAQNIDLIALAGYLRLIPPTIVERYRGRILNIHPALLPAFGGAGMYGRRVHEAVLAAGCRVTGATVHYVDERYDEGRIIVQWPVPVLPGDTADTLGARVLQVEHRIYPAAIDAIARRGNSITAAVDGESGRSGGKTFVLGGDGAPPDSDIVTIARI